MLKQKNVSVCKIKKSAQEADFLFGMINLHYHSLNISLSIYDIISFGTSTPPTKGGEFAYDGFTIQNYHRTYCGRCYPSSDRQVVKQG